MILLAVKYLPVLEDYAKTMESKEMKKAIHICQ